MLKSAFAFLLMAAPGVFASTFAYNVAVNTSSLATTTGTLYFQFNPGDVTSDLATATISNFQIGAPGALTGSPVLSPTATFSAGSFQISNSAANNDALQAIAFGGSLQFRVTLAETLSGSAATGSVFNFGIFQDDGVTPLLTNQIDGYSVIIDLDTLGGAAAQSTTSLASIGAVAAQVPEPGTVLLFPAGLALVSLLRRRSR